MKKIYVGCSLTQAPEDFKLKIEDVKNELRKDFEVLDFVGLTAGTAKDVYYWDIHECVAKCDVFVAICDLPALGLGYELGVAVEKFQKPTIALAHEHSLVTRCVLGIDQPHYQFARYEDPKELPRMIRDFAAKAVNRR